MKAIVDRGYGDYLGITFERFFDPMSLDGEIWKPIKGYDDAFLISNYGRCISKSRLTKHKCVNYRKKRDTVLCPHDNGNGYFQYNLENRHKYIHRLVAQAFIPNPLSKEEVDHIDCNKKNNCVNNLRWATHSENATNQITLSLNRKSQKKNAIIQLNIDGEFIKEWDGVGIASRSLNIRRERLVDVLSSKRKDKTIGIYQFVYKSNYDPNKDYTLFSPEPQGEKRVLSLKTVAFVCDNVVVDAFSSCIDAAEFVGIKRRTMNYFCLKKKNLHVWYNDKLITIKVYRFKELSDKMKKDVKWIFRNKYPLK